MKVGISYAVELSEIPDELQKLIEEVQWELSEKLDLLALHPTPSVDEISGFVS